MLRFIHIPLAGFALVGCEGRNQQIESVSDSDFRQAVRDGNIVSVANYLERGYDINRLGMGGENALHEGILHYEVAKLLLDRGVKVNEKHDYDGTTALIVASIAGNVEARTMKLLLDRGADPAIADMHGKTALDYALQYGREYPEIYQPKIDLLTAATGGKSSAEPAGARQPATRPVDTPEGGDKPQPEAEGRSR